MARESLSKTPAPIKDRIFGSKTNPKGSASSEKSAKSIKLSSDIILSLSRKLKEFKENHPNKKNISLFDLKAVYRRGLGAYSSSHRPTISGGKPNTRNAWAMARVNAFLRKAGGGEHKKAYVQDDDLMKYEGGGLVAPNGNKSNLTFDCISYIKNNQSIFDNGYYFDMNDLSKVIDPYGKVHLNLDFTLVSYNSGGQRNLDVIDTINPTTLVDKLSELLGIEKNQSYVVVHYVIEKAKRLIDIEQIKTEKIVIVDRDKIICENLNNFKNGGEVDDNKETYKKWKSLVNMSKSELERFYNSDEGKESGLSAAEAKSQGIDSGRESARMIMKMKDTPNSEWTPNMWRWAKKQISFISRMKGVQGGLYKPNGEKTRKHLALLIWGHNPKRNNNGAIIENEFDDLNNNELTKVLKSFYEDFSNSPAFNYLGLKDGEYTFNIGDNEFIIYRNEPFTQVEKIKLGRYIEPYFSHSKKPIYSKYFDNYKVVDKNIIIKLKNMYKKGGELKGLTEKQISSKVKEIAKKFKVPTLYIKKQLAEGVKAEMEHTSDKSIASKIALDHLEESPLYYKKLKKMEKSFKKGGEINPDDKKIKEAMTHKSGDAGGLLVGKRHSEGGIKAVNKSTSQPLEMEGGEVVITRNAVSDNKKREFNGEMLTNREILSKINQSGGGVSFDEGGEVEEDCGCSHEDGGELCHYPEKSVSEMLDAMFEDGGEIHERDKMYDMGGLIRIVHKKVPSFKQFQLKNQNISHLGEKKAYKDYLYNVHSIIFDQLPQQIRVGLLLGNQKLVDNHLNS